jgi:hypothetical protein
MVGADVAMESVVTFSELLMPKLIDDEGSTHEPLTLLSRPMAEARFQAAIVRALLAELQHANASRDLKQQVIEELTVLSARILEVADTVKLMDLGSGPRVSDVYPRWTTDAFDDELVSA